MFSLFSRQKPVEAVAIAAAATAASASVDSQQQQITKPVKDTNSIAVVDFNTINNDAVIDAKSKQAINSKSKSGFRLWPFGGYSKVEESGSESKGQPNVGVLTDVNNKVIAMKRLDNVNNNGADITDDFIDIQITKLSYAEVASLTKNGTINKTKKFSNQDQPTLVINKEKELEKSITDLELAEAYTKNKEASKNSRSMDRLNYEEIVDNQILDDDDLDDIAIGGKKISKKFKNKRAKKTYKKQT